MVHDGPHLFTGKLLLFELVNLVLQLLDVLIFLGFILEKALESRQRDGDLALDFLGELLLDDQAPVDDYLHLLDQCLPGLEGHFECLDVGNLAFHVVKHRQEGVAHPELSALPNEVGGQDVALLRVLELARAFFVLVKQRDYLFFKVEFGLLGFD